MGFLRRSYFSPPFSFSLLLLLSLLLCVPVGCTVFPSNNSADLSWTHQLRFKLHTSLSRRPFNAKLAPLTEALVDIPLSQVVTFNITGSLVGVDATNSLSQRGGDIAVISCDNSAYPGELDASETVSNVLTAPQSPSAILLYSTTARHCNYTPDDNTGPFRNIFTLLNHHSAQTIKTQLTSEHHNPSAHIMSFVTPTGPHPTGSAGGAGGAAGGGGGGDGVGGITNNPNTAVAMIILYSITGIITALFLGIIITGAIRAHRHPERYGPRYAPGRTRQSRAKGIARAMVDTIPIVKFGGDQNDGRDSTASQDSVKDDVELAINPEDRAGHLPGDPETGSSAGEEEPEQPNTAAHGGRATPPPVIGTPSDAQKAGNFSCPICTDDFVKGQDIRVLPCNHKFHPECIDPWLLNVSGTCPLCRIDLHPEQDEENEGEGGQAAETPQDGHGETVAGGQANRQHRRITSYLHDTLNARRMRDASVEERLAALRRVREANRGEPQTDGVDGPGQRRRLTTRLRERFRVRTRAHGGQGE